MAKDSPSKADWKQKLTYYAYKLLQLILRCFDVRLVALLGRAIGYMAWMLLPSRRRIVQRNLRIVIDPNLRAAQLRPLIRRNIVLTCSNFACALKVGLMSARELKQSVRLEGADVFEEAGCHGNTAIACIPHAGNWEILARIRPLFTRVEHFGSMYRKFSNPLLEELVYKSRTNYGCEMHSKKNGLRGVLRMARTGGLLGVLSDQYTNRGLFLPYFGKVTGTTPLPSILNRSCKGVLFAVFTRNTGLGRWDAILNYKIPIVENKDNQVASNTMSINQALESCQQENILDGFWMHHRWKGARAFAFTQDESATEVAKAHTKLPFRIIVALPESFEESILTIPALKLIKASRFDAELILICPSAQQEFWLQHKPMASHVLSSDGQTSLETQLEADDIYAGGPFDYLFMFSKQKSTLKQILSQGPLFITGFEEHPFAKKFNLRYTETHCGPPRHRAADYLALLGRHSVPNEIDTKAPSLRGNEADESYYLAPLTTLGAADSCNLEQWLAIYQEFPKAKLIALPEQEEAAADFASKLGCEHIICSAEKLGEIIGSSSVLIAHDGIMPQLAACYGTPVVSIMASRQAARYAPLCEQSLCLYHHSACHPCYLNQCDASIPCSQQIKTADIIRAAKQLSPSDK